MLDTCKVSTSPIGRQLPDPKEDETCRRAFCREPCFEEELYGVYLGLRVGTKWPFRVLERQQHIAVKGYVSPGSEILALDVNPRKRNLDKFTVSVRL